MQEIDEIDTSRDKAKITRKALCARAGIDADTYTRIAKRRNEPNLRTMRRLRAALEALLEEADAEEAGQQAAIEACEPQS